MKPRLKWGSIGNSGRYARLFGFELNVEQGLGGFRSRWSEPQGHWQIISTDHDTEEAAQLAAEAHLRGVLKAALAELGEES